jgi:hypothetical protein
MLMKTSSMALIGIVALLALPLASANPLACTPGSFPTKPVPGGVVGTAWDAAASAYDGSPLAGACVQDPTPDPHALANSACNVLIGEHCWSLLTSQANSQCRGSYDGGEFHQRAGACFWADGSASFCVPTSLNTDYTEYSQQCDSEWLWAEP